MQMNVYRENSRSVKTLEVDPKITPRPKRGYWLRTPGERSQVLLASCQIGLPETPLQGSVGEHKDHQDGEHEVYRFSDNEHIEIPTDDKADLNMLHDILYADQDTDTADSEIGLDARHLQTGETGDGESSKVEPQTSDGVAEPSTPGWRQLRYIDGIILSKNCFEYPGSFWISQDPTSISKLLLFCNCHKLGFTAEVHDLTAKFSNTVLEDKRLDVFSGGQHLPFLKCLALAITNASMFLCDDVQAMYRKIFNHYVSECERLRLVAPRDWTRKQRGCGQPTRQECQTLDGLLTSPTMGFIVIHYNGQADLHSRTEYDVKERWVYLEPLGKRTGSITILKTNSRRCCTSIKKGKLIPSNILPSGNPTSSQATAPKPGPGSTSARLPLGPASSSASNSNLGTILKRNHEKMSNPQEFEQAKRQRNNVGGSTSHLGTQRKSLTTCTVLYLACFFLGLLECLSKEEAAIQLNDKIFENDEYKAALSQPPAGGATGAWLGKLAGLWSKSDMTDALIMPISKKNLRDRRLILAFLGAIPNSPEVPQSIFKGSIPARHEHGHMSRKPILDQDSINLIRKKLQCGCSHCDSIADFWTSPTEITLLQSGTAKDLGHVKHSLTWQLNSAYPTWHSSELEKDAGSFKLIIKKLDYNQCSLERWWEGEAFGMKTSIGEFSSRLLKDLLGEHYAAITSLTPVPASELPIPTLDFAAEDFTSPGKSDKDRNQDNNGVKQKLDTDPDNKPFGDAKRSAALQPCDGRQIRLGLA
ncbi:uncharacterized protein PAC_17262 [Phialocephala subalpina]|uniref:Uncharacterized protein n=1 Tax=Phialocephala subalpina TaxID=576137 RepID=A0A1L7XQP7_9HELO|nr:uncharacterized protein PAC_17262 [Phialocephala subalpina]